MALPLTPEEADRAITRHAAGWWRAWDALSLANTAAAVPVQQLHEWPRVAHWRALASFMSEGAAALTCLEAAHCGHLARGDTWACRREADVALVLCLLDVGAMDHVDAWLARAGDWPDVCDSGEHAAWQHTGALARGVLGGSSPCPALDASARWLREELMPMRSLLSADERLIAAQVLVNHHLAHENYEQFDLLGTLVESEPAFGEASALMRARWWYTLGFAHYQIGNHERADAAWQAALALARAHGLNATTLVTSLAVIRLLIDKGRVVEARRLEGSIDSRWGGGRASQLVLLQQMRARLLLLEDQAARAHATLREALALAAQSGASPPEQASCLTDLVQVLISLQRHGDAVQKLSQLMNEHHGRDASVYRCLQLMLRAWVASRDDASTARGLLQDGLQLAQQLRYTMFFRLLPGFAAGLCALALQWEVEQVFVNEVIRSRGLPAPPDAGRRWPWTLWIRMLGGFELQAGSRALLLEGRSQPKPLELLRLLACRESMSIGLYDAAERLWPEADASARKNIEMTVQRLRRLIGDETLVIVAESRVALDATRVSSDLRCRRALVGRLELMAARMAGLAPGIALPGSEACAGLVAGIRAFGLGALLPGMVSSGWLEEERVRAEREVVEAALAAAQVMRHSGAGQAEQELLERALRHEPMHERLASRLAQAYARDARQADASRVYESFKAALERQGLRMAPRTQALFQRWTEPSL